MSPLLLLLLALAPVQDEREVPIARISKDAYLSAIRELDKASEVIESEPREAVARITAVINNPKVNKNLECRLKIEVQPSIYERHTFFPFQLRGRAYIAVAKRAGSPEDALGPLTGAIADLEKSVAAKVGGSAELLKEARALEVQRKKEIDEKKKPDDPIVEFRPKFRNLITESRFRSAVELVNGPEGQKLSAEQRTALITQAEDECHTMIERRFTRLRQNLGDPSARGFRELSDTGFKRQYSDLVPSEDELTEKSAQDPTLGWLRRNLKSLKSVQASQPGQARLDEVFASAQEALALDAPNTEAENVWFKTMVLVASDLVDETIALHARTAESLPKDGRAKLQAESDKALAAWKEFLEKTDKKILDRHPDIERRTASIQETAKGFPVVLTRLSEYDIDACFLRDPGPELGKVENGLLDIESTLSTMGRVAIESRQELYTKLINASALRRFISGASEVEIVRDLRQFSTKLKAAGGPINPERYGPRVKKVFDSLKQ